MVRPAIRVDGLAELRRDFRRIEDTESLGELRRGLHRAADVVAQDAKRRVPSRTGRARESVRATSGGNTAYVVGGKARVPYYGWLDFGSRSPQSGRSRAVGPWAGTGRGPREGRFIYAALAAKDRQVADLVAEAISDALDRLHL